jgi:hypothetical protein
LELITWVTLIVGVLCLAVGIGLFVWASHKPRARYANSAILIAWVGIGLFSTLIIFALFPESSAGGDVVGIRLSGALAAFVAILIFGSRAGAKALQRDQMFDKLREENDRLKAQSRQPPPPGNCAKPVIREQLDLRYRIPKRRIELRVVTGDLIDVHNVDVWVNSENTNMQMARYYDRSISSVVRYAGASKARGGHPTEDLIANELAEYMQGINALAVEPAHLIPTSAGELQHTHGVKRIYHVAAVRGEARVGYKPIGNIADCVTQALARLDADGEQGHDYKTILFPLLGTGTASGDSGIVYELISSAVQYVRTHRNTRVKTIYFLALYEEHLLTCADAAASCKLDKLGGTAESLLRSLTSKGA